MKSAELYRRLSYAMFGGFVTFLALLSYIAEARPFIDCSFGSYGVGLLDGILITVLTLAVAFYLRSKTNR